MKPLISVVVPIYNVEAYLSDCIDSIRKQTYENLQIILVNDGSPDKCGEICDGYKKIDQRITVIHKENGGLSSARNAGIDICKGEYISFIDSDDYISEYFIEIMYQGILFNDADIVTCVGAKQFLENSDERPYLAQNSKACMVSDITKDTALRKLCYQTIANGAPFRLYKKDIFNSIRFPNGYVFEDVATVYRTFIAAEKMVLVEADIYAYRIRKNSIVRMKFSEKKMVVVPITKTMFKEICDYDHSLMKPAASRAFAQNYHVFLQVPFLDRKNLKIIWAEMKRYRGIVICDNNFEMRKKNKVAAYVTYLGMNISYIVGKLYLKVR